MNTILLCVCMLALGQTQTQPRSADKDTALPIDQAYLARAIECTIAELKFAETAMETTKDEGVRKLARTIEESHNDCLKHLMSEATKHKLGVVEGLSEEHMQVKARLAELKGDEFDREYVRGVIARHEKMIKCCDGQIKDGKVDGITRMCRDDLTVIKQHLAAARKVQTSFEK